GEAAERLAIAQHFHRPRPEDHTHQLGDLRHQAMMVVSQPIPFEHGELGVVPPTPLVGPEDPADLVDATAAGGQQPLHSEFGRGLQPEPPVGVRAGAGIGNREAGEVRTGGRGAAKPRRLHLEHAALGKKAADGGWDLRPPPQILQAGRRPPELRHYTLTRETYSPVRVSTRITSPSGTNSGTRTTAPVSSLAGLVPPLLVSPRTPGDRKS